MMSNYILCKLDAFRKNAFVVNFKLELSLHGLVIKGRAKIDTGCERTSIALQSETVGIDKDTAMELKQEAVSVGLRCQPGFGVNDSRKFRQEQMWLYKSGNYMDCVVLKFDNPIRCLSINDCILPITQVGVSYDRTSNVLIGMDILRHMCFYCDRSIINDFQNDIHIGDYIFIGCWRDNVNADYLNGLCKYFGFSSGSHLEENWFL